MLQKSRQVARNKRKCKYDGLSISICDPNPIHYWNHPDIVALNPQYEQQLNAVDEIIPIVRKGHSKYVYHCLNGFIYYISYPIIRCTS